MLLLITSQLSSKFRSLSLTNLCQAMKTKMDLVSVRETNSLKLHFNKDWHFLIDGHART